METTIRREETSKNGEEDETRNEKDLKFKETKKGITAEWTIVLTV